MSPTNLEPDKRSPEASRGDAAGGSLEEMIGGNILNKLGALILVIGIALFLSYSFETMGPLGRIASGVGLSGALIGIGTFVETKERYKIFARGLLAAGWAGLYFTAYASYALPAAKVIDNPIRGTLLMTAVATAGVLRSLRYRVQSLTALAYGCVFAAFALNEINTFVAISLVPLAASMLYLARRFDWHLLALSAAAGTYGIFLTRPDTGAPLASIQLMLVIYWVMFEAFDLLRLHSRKRNNAHASELPFQDLLFAVNAIAGLAASGALWFQKAPDSMWMFCAGASVLYLVSTCLRLMIGRETLYEFALGISAILAGLAIFGRGQGVWISIAFVLEAEVLFLAAWRLQIPVAKALSWLGFTLALGNILNHWNAEPALIAGLEIQAATAPLLVMAAMMYLNRRVEKNQSYWSYAASALIALAASHQTNPSTLISVTLLIFAAILFVIDRLKQLPEFRYQAYAVALLSLLAAPWDHIVKGAPTDVIVAFSTIAIAGFAATASLLRSSEPEAEFTRSVACLTASFAALIALWMLPGTFVAIGCATLALLLIEIGVRQSVVDVLWNGRALSILAAFDLIVEWPADLWTRVAIASAVAASHYLMRARLRREPFSETHAVVATAIVTGTIFNEVSGGLLTLSWSLEAIALLAAGFALRDRWLRLPGLGLLLVCIAKALVYDLRNLETMYRILSFIGLGLILLSVSFIYTRFKEQLKNLL